MAKVQILADVDALNLTRSINSFIEDKKVIDIKYSSLLTTVDGGRTAVCDRVLIIYEEMN